MGDELFVDTGAWIAVVDADDQYHARAAAYYQRVLREHRLLVTTNLVVAEGFAALRRSAGHAAAMRFLRSISQSPRLIKVYSDAELEADAEAILDRYSDQDFSLVDAVSFALMRRRGIAEAFAFDHHFRVAGFVTMPAAA